MMIRRRDSAEKTPPTMLLKEKGDQKRIFNEQLEKCGVDYFDYYLLHNLTISHYEIAKKFDSFSFVRKMQAEGKIGEVGFSFHDRAQLLDKILMDHPEMDFVQLQINYVDWENESIQSGWRIHGAKRHVEYGATARQYRIHGCLQKDLAGRTKRYRRCGRI